MRVLGAKAGCTLYSIIEAAKLNKPIPKKYIKYLLEVMSGNALTDKFIESILPWYSDLHEDIRQI